MPATIKNLTEGRVFVPIVNYTLARREVKLFEYVEYDALYNNRTVRHLIDVGQIQLISGASGSIPLHASEYESGGGDVVLHQDLIGAGSTTHTQIDAHIADVTTNPHQVQWSSFSPGVLSDLDGSVTDANLSSIFFVTM